MYLSSYLSKIDLYKEIGEYQKAIENYNKVIELDKNIDLSKEINGKLEGIRKSKENVINCDII